MFETQLIEDFIDENIQHEIHRYIMENAEWKFIRDMSSSNSVYPSHGFSHIFKYPDGKISNLYPKIHDTFASKIKKITNYKDIYYNRSFLQLPLPNQYAKKHNVVHVDLPVELPHIACVYYVNNTDGDTVIYEQTIHDVPGQSKNVNLVEHMRVNPKRGSMIFFDGSRYHCSSQPTDCYRCIINFDVLK